MPLEDSSSGSEVLAQISLALILANILRMEPNPTHTAGEPIQYPDYFSLIIDVAIR
ncbi:hypothetical protein EV13_0633 [Prochlorococcus sp. MIT 0702]|nr:hypothetical protein EV12_2573 [Prochlorococcus sp. MIT 0701]KGG29990.1 hypothetical protein EV13_0633 [Prochlorococcus sp. MIT 0702]KGG30971.1 hypothetical protein EV14_2912 [Prochlorococcus sp. MIT 0703]